MTRITPVFALFAVVLAACSAETDAPAGDANVEQAAEAAVQDAPAEAAALPRTPAPADARVFFITPADGDTVQSPVNIEFGIENMGVAPAGQNTEATGHHHLLINAELPPLDQPIPANDNYRHFGDGSTSVSLELEPGTYTLRMLLGDYLHIPHEPAVYSDAITITVE